MTTTTQQLALGPLASGLHHGCPGNERGEFIHNSTECSLNKWLPQENSVCLLGLHTDGFVGFLNEVKKCHFYLSALCLSF